LNWFVLLLLSFCSYSLIRAAFFPVPEAVSVELNRGGSLSPVMPTQNQPGEDAKRFCPAARLGSVL